MKRNKNLEHFQILIAISRHLQSSQSNENLEQIQHEVS